MKTIPRKRFKKTVPTIFVGLFIAALMTGSAWGAESDYYGNYSGSFTGDDSGLWIGLLDASDMAFLSYSPAMGYDGGELFFNSENESTGSFTSTSEQFGTNINVQIDSSTSLVTGTYSNASGDNGNLSGSKITNSPLAGSYSGTIAEDGDALGTWSMTIASDGSVTGSISVENSQEAFMGAAHSQGYFAAIGADFVLFAQITGGSVSGEWFDDYGAEGTFTSGGGGGAPAGGDGGGGGGCFIGSLLK